MKTYRVNLFFVAYDFFLFINLFSSSLYFKYYVGFVYNAMIFLCIMLLVVQEGVIKKSTNKKSLYGLLVLGIIIILMIISISIRRQLVLIATLVFIYCARDISFEDIARRTILISCFALIVIVISSYIGIIDNYIAYQKNGERIRQFLGFRYALYPGAILSNIVLLKIYIKRELITIREILGLFVINYIIYYYTDSRLTFYIICLALIWITLVKAFPKFIDKGNPWEKILVPTYLICGITSYIITNNFALDSNWKLMLNTLFSNRLYLGKRAIDMYGITLLGKSVEWVGNGLDAVGEQVIGTYNYVDCLYIQIAIQYGILFGIILIAVLTYSNYKAFVTNNNYALVLFSIIALHGMVDDLILYIQYNTFWFLAGSLIIGEYRNRKQKQLNIL